MKKHASVIITLWLLAIFASFSWGTYTTSSQARENGIKIGRAFFKLIIITRDWNASHGGVYTQTRQGNDLTSANTSIKQTLSCEDNKQLTLINPALMTAHFSELALKTEGISFRLISLKPTKPENKANPWESKALKQFKTHSVQEITTFTKTNTTTLLHYIAPLYIQTKCLKCHSTKDYSIGDIAGAISITTPLNEVQTSTVFIISHVSGAIFGTLILLFYSIRLQENQKQLIKARVKAEEANQTKSNFLATMSHELRTPLSGIIGMTALIQQKQLPQELKQPITDIKYSAQSLITIINDILDFSKLEVNKLTLTKEPLQLKDLCQECIRLIEPLAANKSLDLQLNVDPILPKWLAGDPLRLRQIILNLLQNSVKFTQTGSIHLNITQQTETTTEIVVKFSIIDTGIGLSPSEQKKLFRPYQQANDATASRHGGTGLGLFICKQLTSLMHGTITVESSKQTGSTFIFTAELSKTTAPKIAEKRPARPQTNHSKSALLAEDSAINRKVLNKILTDYGYNCTCVDNGREALDLATTNRYDIIILDSRMPKLDGPSTSIEIRKTIYGKTTPILAITADITDQEHNLCLTAGMDQVIIKPVDPALLLLTIDQLISQAEQEKPTSPPQT